MANLQPLYKSLSQRKRPEDVAQMISGVLKNALDPNELSTLQKVAKGSLKKQVFGYTSMLQEFGAVIGAETQIEKAIELFHLNEADFALIDATHISDIEEFINTVSPIIHKVPGKNNFIADRLNKFERKTVGMDISKRQYNKKWRLLFRLERKVLKVTKEIRKSEFQKVGKHGLIHQLDFENFAADLNTACFVAYYNARCNLRSTFTNKSQERPFDEVCNMLFNRCLGKKVTQTKGFLFSRKEFNYASNTTNWYAISLIYSDQKVLDNLTDAQKGQLLGRWTALLEDVSSLLQELWKSNRMNRTSMIVQRGNDSTTWNNTANAWNTARDHWINLLYSMGMEYVLDEFCFGKVMRLMAADVAYWHRATGGGLDPNTLVWSKLPLPWKVFNEEAICHLEMVKFQCKMAGVDPKKSGWIAPKTHGVARFKPTPELVHGVAVSSPFLAKVLKKHKYYSGKKNAKAFSSNDN